MCIRDSFETVPGDAGNGVSPFKGTIGSNGASDANPGVAIESRAIALFDAAQAFASG
ncbi:hypothetical protein CKA32_006882 [Geitlerinema sp. FC II]|nr:hypothetical protein CKA32_006882 [Geitlerinema sp. FC II]